MTDTHADIKDILERATKRPWSNRGATIDGEDFCGLAICCPTGKEDGVVYDNAALIVAAVNSFEVNRRRIEELTEAMKGAHRISQIQEQENVANRALIAEMRGALIDMVALSESYKNFGEFYLNAKAILAKTEGL